MIPAIATKFSSSSLQPSPRPQSPKQWKLALQGVKLLYVQRQYKQCAARSAEILKGAKDIHPVYKTYLYYYSAISYDVLGRAAHNYSSNKLSLLRSALDYFITCNLVLPDVLSVTEDSSPASLVDGPSGISAREDSPASLIDGSFSSDLTDSPCMISLVSSITRIIDSSIDCEEEDPFISDDTFNTTSFPFKLPPSESKRQLLPSPLRVRKSFGDLRSISQAMSEVEKEPAKPKALRPTSQPMKFHLPPPLPIKIVPSSTKTNPTKDTKITDHSKHEDKDWVVVEQNTPATPVNMAAIIHFNNNVKFLRSQVSASIADIQSLIDEVTELQRARQASRNFRRSASFWSFSPVKDHSDDSPGGSSGRTIIKETKEQRIERLRAEGWTTVGLKSRTRGWKGEEYYRSFCSSVLDELYFDM